jgi:hypothetical protein
MVNSSLFVCIGQTPDLPATHVAFATVAPFPAWRVHQANVVRSPKSDNLLSMTR